MQLSIVKTTLLPALFATFSITASAQTYGFEDSEIPLSWKAESGKLSLNQVKFKEGSQSLQWQTQGESKLNVRLATPVKISGNKAYYLQLYSAQTTNDTLKIELMDREDRIRQTIYLCLNFKGWREICRYHTEFLGNGPAEIKMIRFVLEPKDKKALRQILFDEVNFDAPKPKERLIGTQWVLDYSFFPVNDRDNFDPYLNPIDLPVDQPSADELAGLKSLREQKNHRLQPRRGNDTEVQNAVRFAKELNISRTADNQITGKPFGTRPETLPEARIIAVSRHLEVLAAESQYRQLFADLLDFLLDQGFAEGVGVRIRSSSYTAARNVPQSLLNLLPKCSPEQQTEVLNLTRWLSFYGNLYFPQEVALKEVNSDLIYNYTPNYMKIALNQTTDAESVRELRALKRWFDRSGSYTPTDFDMLKPDGTGFHHGTHYNGYMYAYTTYANYLNLLKETPFQVEKSTYENFRKAYISYYLMLTRAKDDERFMAFSLGGRNPSSLKGSINRVGFENLIAAGDLLCGGADNEARAAYNYFFLTNKYPVPAADLNGFHAFNYSPVGIYRGNGWTVTMRSPTTRSWGAEIYNGTNRFGRYQSTGSLEVMYDGQLNKSGYLDTKDLGGWDWNAVPGTTVVRYNKWREMMPNANTKDRFDQYTETKDFSGSLAWDKIGLFAADFDQTDKWGSPRFTPTNLAFKKSVLAIDGLLISIGSNISASGSYEDDQNTVTNLFQSIVGEDVQPMFVNGKKITDPYSAILQGKGQHTLISPQKTAYILPKGNDDLQVIWGEQSSPKHTGEDVDTPIMFQHAAKAYLNHGVKTSDKKYQMVIVPNSTPKTLKPLSEKIKKGELYTLAVCSSKLHVVQYNPQTLTAYTFFEPVENTGFGIVKGSDSEGLVLCKPSEKEINFAVCNPNRRPQGPKGWHKWTATPTVMTLRLSGRFALSEAVEEVSVEVKGEETLVTIRLPLLLPQYFSLVKK